MKNTKQVSWDKLDNTALLFPVIASESMSSVWRISCVLTEPVDRACLQAAQEKVLKSFSVFRMRLRTGLFWYYFEENRRPYPPVVEEHDYPGSYINRSKNNQYLFRLTYYDCRINLEVFHALTDGFGGVVFIKEIIYQYLRFRYPEALAGEADKLSSDIFLDYEDSYIKNYRKTGGDKKRYKNSQAVTLHGEHLPDGAVGLIEGIMPLAELKRVAHEKGVSLNTLLVGVYCYAIYREYLGGRASDEPVACAVPVNLRPYYESHTMKNFFAIVTAEFLPDREGITLDEVLQIVSDSLKGQITKENLDEIITYNVSNERNLIVRLVPLVIKRLAVRQVYEASSHACTTTVTNIGRVELREPYRPYVRNISCLISMSSGQNMKAAVVAYEDRLTITFTSVLAGTSVQGRFFQTLTGLGVHAAVHTNGVYEE